MSESAIDIRKRLEEAIDMQRARLWAFKAMKDREQRDEKNWNDAVRVMANLIKEARALIKDGISWSRNLGADERREVIASWFASLPPNQQRLLLEELQKTQTMRVA